MPVDWHEVSRGMAREEARNQSERPFSSREMESQWKVLKAEK